VSKSFVALSFAVALGACGGAQQYIQQGNQLLAQGKHAEAIQKFEEALRIEPGNAKAHERVKEARREQVRAQLDTAEQELAAADYAGALRDALKARRLPLDLDDVDLVRRIDDTIAKASRLAEERVSAFVEQGHFVPAVELSAQVRDASPGVSTRERWARDVQQKATEHYLQLATSAEAALPGSAAVQLAMAKKAGASVEAAKVTELWNRFAVPTCFSEPRITVNDKTGKAGDLLREIETAARKELAELRGRCGEGTQPLGVTIALATLEVVDKTDKERGIKPLPGFNIKTEEVYYEEEPYTVMEEVTEEQVKKELQEKRDCAPKPGKERGCRTWTEEVDIKVPVKQVKEVTKVRRIEKRRPIVGELPADKVVTYEVTRVTRRVTVSGRIEVLGGVGEPRVFSLAVDSVDEGHPEVKHPKLSVPADPLEAKTMPALLADASAAVSREVGNAVAGAVEGWSKRYEEEAAKQVLAGRLPEAEEIYLKLLALGAGSSKAVSQYFQQRYGRSVPEDMAALGYAMGRTPEAPAPKASGAAVASATSNGFPRLEQQAREAGPSDSAEETSVQASSTVRAMPAVPMVPKRPSVEKPAGTTGMTDEELKALEAESLNTSAPATPPEATEAAPGAPAAGTEQRPVDGGSEEPKARGPVKPKT
jgi:tetratricopeptide (TPR) repeat protein